MTAYDTLDQAIAGLKYGLQGRVESMACAESAGIEFGRPVFGYVGNSVKCYSYHTDTGKIVFDADFVTSNTIDITVQGVSAAQVTFTTDHDTMAGLVVAAVTALTGVVCVLDTTDATNRTFLIQVIGATALVTEAVAAGSSQADGTITYGSSQVYLGISMFVQNEAGNYTQYDAISVMADGEVWVTVKGAVKAQDEAYVYTTAGADLGKAGSSDKAINARFRSDAADGALARMRTHGQTEFTYAGLFN